MKLALLSIIGILSLAVFPIQSFSQISVTKLDIENLLDVAIDITITYDDNTTMDVSLAANDQTTITAPSGKSIRTLTAGTKTVALLINPVAQTGWNILNTAPSETVTATFFDNGNGDAWGAQTPITASPSVVFSY